MKMFTYSLETFESMFSVVKGTFDNDNVVVDNEIMNDISADWNYLEGKPFITGILHKDKIMIFCAEKEDDADFKLRVMAELNELRKDNKIYAFNKFMEQGNFKGAFDYEIEIDEIKPFNARGWNKDRFYEELKEKNVIDQKINIKDIFGGDGLKCPIYWEKYLKTGEWQLIMDCVSHNINCLLKESLILKNHNYFKENFKIDKKGWLIE